MLENTNENENSKTTTVDNQNTFSKNGMQWQPKIQNANCVALHLVSSHQLENMNVLQQISKQE